MTGWMTDPSIRDVWGRPVAVFEMPDGSLPGERRRRQKRFGAFRTSSNAHSKLVPAAVAANRRREQKQPIFSHAEHLGYGVSCVQCHASAATSTRAEDNNLPKAEACRGCHSTAMAIKSAARDGARTLQPCSAHQGYRFAGSATARLVAHSRRWRLA